MISKRLSQALEIEDDITSKIIFLLGKNILSNISTSNRDTFYFAENIDSIAEIMEDIIYFVDENVEDLNIMDAHGEHIASPINSYLTGDPNSLEYRNTERNIALNKAEHLVLKSFVSK